MVTFLSLSPPVAFLSQSRLHALAGPLCCIVWFAVFCSDPVLLRCVVFVLHCVCAVLYPVALCVSLSAVPCAASLRLAPLRPGAAPRCTPHGVVLCRALLCCAV